MIWSRLWAFYRGESDLALLILGNVIFGTAAGLLALTAVLLRWSNDRKARHWARLEAAWESVTLDVVIGLAPAEAAWSVVAPRDRLYFVNYLLRFAKRVSGVERRIVDELAAPYLDLIVPQLKRRTSEHRARAIQTLSRLGSRRYSATILTALDDPSPLVAMVAARALAHGDNAGYASEILQRMHRFDRWRPSFLASMLAAMGPAVAPTLRQALGDPGFDPRVRAVAADALRELNDFAAADTAALALDGPVGPDLAAAMLNLLARFGRAEHLPAIRRHALSAEPIVRARAILALGHVGAPEDLPFLVGAFHDDSPWVALRAAEALVEARALDALASLARLDHPRAPLAQALLAGKPA